MEEQKYPSGAKILPCTCKHESQDKLHGRGRRVHSVGGVKGSIKYKCSVCGAIKSK